MVTKEQMVAFFSEQFPQAKCTIEAVGNNSSTIKYPIGPGELRPGGSVAGPVLMLVADVAIYVAILGEIGFVTMVVTSSLNFDLPPLNESSLIERNPLN